LLWPEEHAKRHRQNGSKWWRPAVPPEEVIATFPGLKVVTLRQFDLMQLHGVKFPEAEPGTLDLSQGAPPFVHQFFLTETHSQTRPTSCPSTSKPLPKSLPNTILIRHSPKEVPFSELCKWRWEGGSFCHSSECGESNVVTPAGKIGGKRESLLKLTKTY